MSQLFDSQARGLAIVIKADGGSFIWKGHPYNCVIDHVAHTITTAKSFFPEKRYPKCGDPITVGGKTFQITRKGNAEIKPVAGGYVEDPPFVDDSADPSLDLTFEHYVKK